MTPPRIAEERTKAGRVNWGLLALVACAVAGAVLRLIYTSDMEWKEDEYYNYVQAVTIGATRPWPWVGMPSGVYLANPGMSIWVFAALARMAGLFCASVGPLELARAVALFAWAGILLVPFFAYRWVRQPLREPWLWTYALAMVNPFAVFYQRKLWPEPFLPAFMMVLIAGWWKRDAFWGAVAWGLMGALVGQIHMSGFFLAAGLVLFTVGADVLRGMREREVAVERESGLRTHWWGWLTGSALGGLPLVPWLLHLHAHPTGQPMTTGWSEILQFKFWAFWLTDPFGLVLSNPLGLHRGDPLLVQLGDFIRYPLIGGHATWLCAVAHVVIFGCAVTILLPRRLLFRKRATPEPAGPQATLLQRSALWGFGVLMTATGVNIRRYYMMVAFPLGFLWVTCRALADPRRSRARALLFALWLGELVVSAVFIHYVHVHQGSVDGDYGEAYHVQQERHERATGELWPDLRLPIR